jgi:heme oxygenase
MLLGVAESALTTLPRCNHLPELSDYEQLLGYLYVMEGSTLGGQIITGMLLKQFQISPDEGARFFYGYGANTKYMWDTFCETLNAITDKDKQNTIIYSSRLTYNTLHQWMDM